MPTSTGTITHGRGRISSVRRGDFTESPGTSDEAAKALRALEPRHCAPEAARAGDGAVGRGRVLVIASRFPPVASVGATRVRKFVKYLGDFGWRPYVITGATRVGTADAQDVRRACDWESVADVPADVAVHRLDGAWDDWPGHAALRCATLMASLFSRPEMGITSWTGILRWRFQKLCDRLSFPDRGIWRLIPAVRLGLSLHRRHGFDAIFSSGMPFSDHIAALVLQSLIRRPWIADFRDPWVEYVHWDQWRGEAGRALTELAEAAVVNRAGMVVSVNERMTERFRQRYPTVSAGRFQTVSNGYDPADFPLSSAPANEKFRLLYAGSLYRTRTPDVLLAGYERFVGSVAGARDRVRLDFAGRSGPHMDEIVRGSVSRTVGYLGILSHATTQRAMAEADVNIILLPKIAGGESDTTAKLYECIGSGRAILAIVPKDGAAAAVLRSIDGVWICDPDQADDVKRALTAIYGEWLSNRSVRPRDGELLRRMTRRFVTGRLASHLDRICRRGFPRKDNHP